MKMVCLIVKHRYSDCNQKNICNVNDCEEYHNFLLHKPKFLNVTKSSNVSSDAKVKSELTGMTSVEMMNTLYRLLHVTLFNPINAKSSQTWAFLDITNYPELTGDREEFCTTWTDECVRTYYESRRIKLQISGYSVPKRFNLEMVTGCLPLGCIFCMFNHVCNSY